MLLQSTVKTALISCFILILTINCKSSSKFTLLEENGIYLYKRQAVIGELLKERTDLTGQETRHSHSIGNITNLQVDSFNNIYGIDTHLNKILSFDSTGLFRKQFLNIGQGPGEMTKPFQMSIYSDTIWVSDLNQQKVCLFSVSGEFLKEIHFEQSSPTTFAKIGNLIYLGSWEKNKILTVYSLKSEKETTKINKEILKAGRDIYETRTLYLSSFYDFNNLAIIQPLLGTLRIINLSDYHTIFNYDFFKLGLEGLGKNYIESQINAEIVGKNGPVKPYWQFINEAFTIDNEFYITFFIKEKSMNILAVKIDLTKEKIFTPIFSDNIFSYVSTLVKFHDSNSIYLYNQKYQHLEKWSTITREFNHEQ